MDLSAVSIGERVNILFDIGKDLADAIDNLANRDVRAYNHFGRNKEYSVSIPFRVIDKSTSFTYARESPFRLQAISKSAYLQAERWEWEDIFLWVCLGDKPGWAGE